MGRDERYKSGELLSGEVEMGARSSSGHLRTENYWELERRSSFVVAGLAALLCTYWCSGFLILGYLTVYLLRVFTFGQVNLEVGPAWWFLLAATGLMGAAAHWRWSTRSVIRNTLRYFDAKPLDRSDPYHKAFKNIVDEILIAAGNRIPIKCVVIPCASLNGFALRDPARKAVVGVTEGMLARTKREELQAVVAQLTGQVLSCDALVNTVAYSLFGQLEQALDRLSQRAMPTGGARGLFLSTRAYRSPYSSASKSLLIAVCRAFLSVGYFLNTTLSRQRVFRSDALSVQLTRDPMGLAMILRRLRSAWRGSGTFGPQTQAILFVPTKRGKSDRSMGFLSSLFSTHPPLEQRFRRVLAMAGTTVEAVDELLKEKSAPKAVPFSSVRQKEKQMGKEYLVYLAGKWQGPYRVSALHKLSLLTAETLVSPVGSGAVLQAGEDPVLRREFFDRGTGKDLCPRCKVQLSEAAYEGVRISYCPTCQGKLVPFDSMQRILTRQLVPISEEIQQKARRFAEKVTYQVPLRGRKDDPERIPCPKCSLPMSRGFYSPQYFIEVDRCLVCHLLWFDTEELELLQALVQKETEKLFSEAGKIS